MWRALLAAGPAGRQAGHAARGLAGRTAAAGTLVARAPQAGPGSITPLATTGRGFAAGQPFASGAWWWWWAPFVSRGRVCWGGD
jgi:hypothetical protein